MNIEKAMYDNRLKLAQTVKALADAEAAESGPQIQLYLAELDALNQRMKDAASKRAVTGGMGTMENPPVDGKILPIS